MFGFLSMFSVLTHVPTILASVGLVIATSSFISGLQLVKAANIVEGKIHRLNGITTIVLYNVLLVMAFIDSGFGIMRLIGWSLGLLVILTKLYIVRGRKRRAYKYVSWMGATLILIWLYLVIIHIPV